MIHYKQKYLLTFSVKRQFEVSYLTFYRGQMLMEVFMLFDLIDFLTIDYYRDF